MGASLTLAFAPFNAWWLPFIVLPIWFFVQANVTKHSFKTAWFFNFGYFAAGISWIHVSIAEHGGLPLIVSIAMIAVLCAYLAVFPAIAIWLTNRFFSKQFWPFTLPLFWLALEFARAHFMTGFPWLSIGYSQLEGPLSGWIPIIGEIGVSAILILITVNLGLTLRLVQTNISWRIKGLQTIIVGFIFCVSGLVLNSINWTEPSGEMKRVSMVQGNIEQTIRWVPEQDQPTMQKYWDLSSEHWNADLIIWPEAAIPKLEIATKGFLELVDKKATETNTALITGIVDVNYNTEKIYNNLISLGNDKLSQNTIPYAYGHKNRFAKHHLLPIGEFVPFESILRTLAPIFDLPMSSFTRGSYVQANLLANGIKLAPAICFEIAFPNQIRANLNDDTDAIITVSNDAWFGNSHGPHQHLEIAQMRAKEFGLPVLRSTNTGVTAFVDHKGMISAIAPQFEDTVLTHDVLLVAGKTPYRELGNLPVYVCFLVLFIIGTHLQRKIKMA
ncbi:MAG: apolipoprotein N-acyltransferase [Glaciecola sp.]